MKSRIRLVSETLRIKVPWFQGRSRTSIMDTGTKEKDQQEVYSVHAIYTLENPSKDSQIQFGLPLIALDEEKAKHHARSVRIFVNGKKQPRCRIIPAPLDNEKRSGLPVHPIVRLLDNPESWYRYIGGEEWFGWCVSTITIPQAKRARLELHYEDEFLFNDFGHYCSWEEVRRHLYYPLSPAGSWAGKAELVDLEIDLGPLARLAKVIAPRGHKRKGHIVTWRWRNVDLGKKEGLHVVYDIPGPSPDKQMARVNNMYERSGLSLSAKKMDDIPLLLDGKLETSYCSLGPGSSIEVRLLEHPHFYTYNYKAWARLHPDNIPGKKRPMLHDIPSIYWGKPDPSFLIVHPDPDPRMSSRIDTVRVSLCGQSKKPHQDFALAPIQSNQLMLEGQLKAVYLRQLKRWGEKLQKMAKHCTEPCIARAQKKCQKPTRAKRVECWVREQGQCEMDCLKAVSKKLSKKLKGPCLRFTILKMNPTMKKTKKSKGSCISEFAADFKSCI